jgi:hypothetical protein
VKQGTKSYEFDNYNPTQFQTGVKVANFNTAMHASDPAGAYFSAWYYIGAGYELDGKFRNNFQWKTNNACATVKGGVKTVIGFETKDAGNPSVLQVEIGINDCNTMMPNAGVTIVDGCKARQNNPVPVPRNQWFHLEVYYKAAKTNGRITIWQDGQMIFDLSGANFNTLTKWGQDNPTIRSDNQYLYWGLGSYADQTLTTRQLIYIDDARITDYRVGPGATPTPTPTPTPTTTPAPTPTPTSGPSAWWKFDETSGSTASDASGNARTGTLFSATTQCGNPPTAGCPTWTAGRIANALSLDGTNDRVTGPSLTLPSTFTYAGWVYNPSNAPYETIMTVGSNRDLYLGNGVITFYDGTTDRAFGSAISTNAWHHVALTSDGTNLRAYLDGVQQGTAQAVALGSYTGTVQVGSWISGTGDVDFFGGTLDDIRIYNRSLT